MIKPMKKFAIIATLLSVALSSLHAALLSSHAAPLSSYAVPLSSYAATSSQPTADTVIMTVAGKPVTLSEFEYSYNKNNSEGVIDKKTVEEYVDLFVNYKLKVAAALDAKYDTLTSFKQEFAQYRDQQVLPMLTTDDDMLK